MSMLVAGAGGIIGGQFVKELECHRLSVRVVGRKYGPCGTWDEGREALSAAARKMALAVIAGTSEIDTRGDGKQIGDDEMVGIKQRVGVAEEIAGAKPTRVYKPDAPLGVRGRNSDNILIRDTLGPVPTIGLYDGIEHSYRWAYDQAKGFGQSRPFVAAYD